MSARTDLHDPALTPRGGTAVLVVDRHGRVAMCAGAVRELTGEPPEAVCGSALADLLTPAAPAGAPASPEPPGDPAADRTGGARDGGPPEDTARRLAPDGRAVLRRRDGEPLEVRVETRRMRTTEGAALLVELVPVPVADRRDENEALVRALFEQTRVGLAIHDMNLLTTRLNHTPQSTGPPTEAGVHVYPVGRGIEEILLPGDAAAVRERLRRVAETGEPLVDWVTTARRRNAPERERTLSFSAFRLEDRQERPMGVAVIFTDVTDQHVARARMELLHAAAERIGHSLDVTSVAGELVEVLVSHGFAGLAAVDLSSRVLLGEEPEGFQPGAPLRRVAVASAAGEGHWPSEIHPLDATIRPRSLETDKLRQGAVVFQSDLADWREDLAGDPERSRLLLPSSATSFMAAPLTARGLVLGALVLWRTGDQPPFGGSDADLVEEIASRASLGLDNARRYTRERRTAETLQRSLLPPAVTDTSAARTAGIYRPAGMMEGIGGTWFDVIPLSSTRLAFVTGEVAGHGLGATAAMGRLRTAVQTLADLDLTPGELLSHLDDIVLRLADTETPFANPEEGGAGGAGGAAGTEEGPPGPPGPPDPGESGPGESGEEDRMQSVGRQVAGATCLYCVYDPVTGRCAVASAGHPPPVLARSGEEAGAVRLTPGPPLGAGALPFESVEFDVGPDGLLVFYNDPLLAGGSGTTREERVARLGAVVAEAATRHSTPTGAGQEILRRLLPEAPADDVSLLLARTRLLPDDTVAAWEFSVDPAEVARARVAVQERMAAWDLGHLADTTELIASELLTNAIRYGGAPVGLRLIRDETLICEVSDSSQTQPRLRRAQLSDEGGRGLFLVARLTHRWGSRYTDSGKTIWAEQSLDPQEADDPLGPVDPLNLLESLGPLE
ncbi:ATP-binding SpoIIE family protein phosphatase [Streptomyces daliensis]